jgi:hypothetical protein
MADINEPNYVHYSRLQIINFDEAASLLAHFELRDKNVTAADEYNELFIEEKRLANKVLYDANMHNTLNCFRDDGIPTDVIYYYKPELVMVNVVDFCNWANDLNYGLPKELLKIISNANHAKSDDIKNTNTNCTTDAPQEVDTRNKGGKPKGYLTEAIEYAYLKYRDEGNTEILREGKIREFCERLKELADEKSNPNFSTVIANRIDCVKIAPAGCTVTTKDKYLEASKTREIKEKGRKYTQQRISQILVELREKFPLPS